MKKLIFLFVFISFSFSQAQDNSTDDSQFSLSQQFEELYRKSSTYQEYKVISMVKYNQLKSNVVDSLNAQIKLVEEKNNIINRNNNELKNLKQELIDTKKELKDSISLKDSRSIFGMSVEKSVFSSIIVLTYLILITLTIFFAFKYRQNISNTKKAVSDVKALELEYENHKKSSLKRFQEVNRKLQDELNKNWKKEK
ncbi:hypothetical protein ACXGQW_07410 [Wenyingzhuangia sp. IMCC45533]